MQSVPQKKHQSSWISYMMTQALEARESQVDARTVFYDLQLVQQSEEILWPHRPLCMERIEARS